MPAGGRSYSGPVYPGSITCLAELNLAMKWLVKQPPIPSAMAHGAPCTIGETVEEALSLPPSTTRIDLVLTDAAVELKSDRITASSPKSEATSTFQSDDGSPFFGSSNSDRYRQVVEKYGYTTASAAVRGMKTRKNYHNRINLYHKLVPTPHHVTDLFIEYDSSQDRIWVCHISDGRLLYYDQTNIDEIKIKYKLQYCPHAIPIMIGGTNHFDFVSVDALTTTMSPFNIQTIWSEIVNGNQVLEFRAHICDDVYCPSAGSNECGEPGYLRCRGSAFRTPKSRIGMVWVVTQVAP